MAVEVGAGRGFPNTVFDTSPSTTGSEEGLLCLSATHREASWASRSNGTATWTEPPPSACPGIPSAAWTPGTWTTTCPQATISGGCELGSHSSCAGGDGSCITPQWGPPRPPKTSTQAAPHGQVGRRVPGRVVQAGPCPCGIPTCESPPCLFLPPERLSALAFLGRPASARTLLSLFSFFFGCAPVGS